MIKRLIQQFYNNYIFPLKKDYVLHSYISTILTLILFTFLPIIYSVSIVFFIGLFKEFVIDQYIMKSKADENDVYANIVGIFVAIIIQIFILLI